MLTSSPDASPTVAAVRATISAHLPSGLHGHLTGQLPTAVDNQNSQASAQKRTEVLSNLVILLMLIIVFRAVLAPLVTLGPAVLVLQIAGHVIGGMADHGLQVSTITETMLTVLIPGAGTDYGLFLTLRVREEMADGAEPRAAIERAARYVGESITFSAGTVIVALLCLLLASFGLYSGLGPALAVGVAIMLLAALYRCPRAAGGVRGHAVFWPSRARHPQREGRWARLTDVVIAHPVAMLTIGVVFLGGLAVAATAYTSSGFGGTSTGPPGSDSAAGTAAINANYPPAVANPTVVLLVYKSSVWQDPLACTAGRERPGQEAGIRFGERPAQPQRQRGQHPAARRPVRPARAARQAARDPAGEQPGHAAAIRRLPRHHAVRQPQRPRRCSSTPPSRPHTSALSSTTAALNAVPAVRSAVTSVQHTVGAVDNGVNGLAPASYDVNTVSSSDLEDDLAHRGPAPGAAAGPGAVPASSPRCTWWRALC